MKASLSLKQMLIPSIMLIILIFGGLQIISIQNAKAELIRVTAHKENLYFVVYESYHPLTGKMKGFDVIKHTGEITSKKDIEKIKDMLREYDSEIDIWGYVKMETLN